MQLAPQEYDDVQLLDGKIGYVRGTISYWGNLRCWDVYLFHPGHTEPVRFFGFDETVRIGQIRSAPESERTRRKRLAAEPLSPNPPLWREVKP